MKNVTLSAEDHLIEQARELARANHTTLNQAFRDWLQSYVHRESAAEELTPLAEQQPASGQGGSSPAMR